MAMDLQALFNAIHDAFPETERCVIRQCCTCSCVHSFTHADLRVSLCVCVFHVLLRVLAEHSRRGKPYVDEYIRAFYLPTEDEALNWVRAHKHVYSRPHLLSLIANGIGAKMKKKKAREMRDSVESILNGE